MPGTYKIPMSHRFLTELPAVMYPLMYSPPGAAYAYPIPQIKQILMHPDCTKSEDLFRIPWNFKGQARDQKNYVAIIREQENEERKDQEEEVQEQKVDEGYLQQLKESFKNIAGGNQFSEEEILALLALSQVDGRGAHLQGGVIWGVSQLCFKACWLKCYHYVLNEKQAKVASKGTRVERLPTRQLQVSTCLETQAISHDETYEEVSKNRILFSFYSEQKLEQREEDKSEEDSTFSLTPSQQTLTMDSEFFKNNILQEARKRLNDLKYFTPEDFFALIPCLCDKKFRKDFCKKLAKRPEYEYECGLKWIAICYEGQDEELKVIQALLREEREAALKANKIQKIHLAEPADLIAQRRYFNHPEFLKEAAEELKDRTKSDECKDLIQYIIISYTGGNLAEGSISACAKPFLEYLDAYSDTPSYDSILLLLVLCLNQEKLRDKFFEKLRIRSLDEIDKVIKWIDNYYKVHNLFEKLEQSSFSEFKKARDERLETLYSQLEKCKSQEAYKLLFKDINQPSKIIIYEFLFKQLKSKNPVSEPIQQLERENLVSKPKMLYLQDPEFRQYLSQKLASYNVAEYNNILWLIQKNREEAYKQVYDCIPISTRFRNNNFINANNKKIVASLILGGAAIVLAATGVLAPLGAALGWTGLTLTSPAATAAFVAFSFMAPTIFSIVGRGLVGICKALLNCLHCFLPPRSSQQDSSANNASTARATTAFSERGNSKLQEDKQDRQQEQQQGQQQEQQQGQQQEQQQEQQQGQQQEQQQGQQQEQQQGQQQPTMQRK